jgi:hypothetical protein
MRIALPILVCLALTGTSAARAAEPDSAALQHEIKALREMVLDLQARVSRLEGGPPPKAQIAPLAAPRAAPVAAPIAAPVAANAGYVSPEAALRSNWSQVKPDMDQGEVLRLLGEPSKRFTLDGRTIWYYHYPATGTGSVFFTDAGRVSSRQSPFGWGG